MREKWRSVVGYEGRYEISDCGNVRSLRTPCGTYRQHPLTRKSQTTACGHLKIQLQRPKNFYIHRLVLEAFVGSCPPGLQCRHLDGDPTNNALGNLVWGTQIQNYADRRRHGVCNTGERNGMARLTWRQVRIIRELKARGCPVTQQRLAKWFDVPASVISNIRRGIRWQELA